MIKDMIKKNLIKKEGTVTKLLPEEKFEVTLDKGYVIMAYAAGKMRRNKIKVLLGDKVSVEMDKNYLTKGRIVHRDKS